MFMYDRFEDLIRQTGVTKASIARKLKRTPTICQDWKHHKSEPSAHQLSVVAAALGTTAAYLTGQTDDPAPLSAAPGATELDTRLQELLLHADERTKLAMLAFLQQLQNDE